MAAVSHLERFAAARYPDRHRILGRTLKPLALGHIMLLARLKHPLVTGNGRYDEAAVALGVAICSCQADKVHQKVDGRLFGLRVFYLGILARFARQSFGALAHYLTRGCTGPRLWSKGDAGKKSSMPMWVCVLICLRRDLGMSESEAMRIPLAEALWLCSGIWESNGGVEVQSEEETRLFEEMRKGN